MAEKKGAWHPRLVLYPRTLPPSVDGSGRPHSYTPRDTSCALRMAVDGLINLPPLSA